MVKFKIGDKVRLYSSSSVATVVEVLEHRQSHIIKVVFDHHPDAGWFPYIEESLTLVRKHTYGQV